jgi:hypothetical protein
VQIEPQWLKVSDTATYFGVSEMLLMEKIEKGVFVAGVHIGVIPETNITILNIKRLEELFLNEAIKRNKLESILERLI